MDRRPAALRAERLESRDTPTALGGVPEITAPLAVSGTLDGRFSAYAPTFGGQYATTPGFTLAPFAGFTGVVRVAVGDVNGDTISDYVAVTGPGTPTRLAVLDGITQAVIVIPFDPFNDPNFVGGAFVAVGQIDGDGRGEIVVSPDLGGGPRVKVFGFAGTPVLVPRADFLGIDDPNFRGGVRVAVGNVNADAFGEIAVAAGFSGGPRVALFNGATLNPLTAPLRLVNDFFAFGGTDAETLRNGVYVASGDTNSDGIDDLIFGGGPGGAPRVLVLNGVLVSANNAVAAQAAPLSNFFSGNPAARGGIRVAAKSLSLGLRDEVVTGSGEGDPARVRVYFGVAPGAFPDPAQVQEFGPFGNAATGGVFVG